MDVKVGRCNSVGEQYQGKGKLIEPNIKSLHIGREHANTLNLACPPGLRLKKS